MPKLDDQNIDAWILWNETNTQWRSKAFDLIGLDYLAVTAEAKRLGIELTQCTMKKIKALEAYILTAQHKKDDNDANQGYQEATPKFKG